MTKTTKKFPIKQTDFTSVTIENTLKTLNEGFKINEYENRFPPQSIKKKTELVSKVLLTRNWDED